MKSFYIIKSAENDEKGLILWLRVISYFTIQAIIMGGITSLCCEQDTDSTKSTQIALKVKEKRPRVLETKVTKEITKEKMKDISEGNKNEEIRKAEETMLEIQGKCPLPKDRKGLSWEDFEITHRIGIGGFGQVFLGELVDKKEKGKSEKYAIKRIPKSQIYRNRLIANLKLERQILSQSSCNFITTLHYAFRDAKYWYLVMEWAEGGDIFTLLNKKHNRMHDFYRAGEKAVRFILACIVMGIEYLHSKNIMYRDLKPQNVLIFEDGYVKLTDFGVAKRIQKDEMAKSQAGTMLYFAPEMVLKKGYGKEIDLWTLGVFAYEISNYSPPFTGPEINDPQKVKKLVKYAQKNRHWVNRNLSNELKDFISSLLKFQPKERLGSNSWDQIKNHAFFTSANFDWASLKEMKMKSPLRKIIKDHKKQYQVYRGDKQPEVTQKSHEEQFYYTWSKNSNNL